MGWRSKFAYNYTVVCIRCGHESTDVHKRPTEKYSSRKCKSCGYTRPKKDNATVRKI